METPLTVLLVAIVALLIAQLPRTGQQARTAYRLSEIERRLKLVMDHLGVDDRTPLPAEVREHLARGDKIKAIAAYRKVTGADLRSAKAAVEAITGPVDGAPSVAGSGRCHRTAQRPTRRPGVGGSLIG